MRKLKDVWLFFFPLFNAALLILEYFLRHAPTFCVRYINFKAAVFRDFALCVLIDIDLRFKSVYCLHHQGMPREEAGQNGALAGLMGRERED
jgi:hypothetical protein